MPILIQLAVATDLESLLVLMRQMQNDDPWSEPFDETVVRRNLFKLLHNSPYGLTYLARDEHGPVAYLAICFDYSLRIPRQGRLDRWTFCRAYASTAGSWYPLLDLAESASRESGAQFLHLEVNHGNSAIELYRRRGFVDHLRFLMTKSLNGSP